MRFEIKEVLLHNWKCTMPPARLSLPAAAHYFAFGIGLPAFHPFPESRVRYPSVGLLRIGWLTPSSIRARQHFLGRGSERGAFCRSTHVIDRVVSKWCILAELSHVLVLSFSPVHWFLETWLHMSRRWNVMVIQSATNWI